VMIQLNPTLTRTPSRAWGVPPLMRTWSQILRALLKRRTILTPLATTIEPEGVDAAKQTLLNSTNTKFAVELSVCIDVGAELISTPVFAVTGICIPVSAEAVRVAKATDKMTPITRMLNNFILETSLVS